MLSENPVIEKIRERIEPFYRKADELLPNDHVVRVKIKMLLVDAFQAGMDSGIEALKYETLDKQQQQ